MGLILVFLNQSSKIFKYLNKIRHLIIEHELNYKELDLK
jgi:hypothetical protein